ncbi:hypothetical protein LCGC14_1562810 [marine sediment metagenome]|uniref:Uncharacterized protein n=1 Tax=marine sediment metagenome TaxID=412755 RepID=A0A0F9J847_9ZZZZ
MAEEDKMKCSICGNEAGEITVLKGIPYCNKCYNKLFEEKEINYYGPQFLDCPFCKLKIDITNNTPKNCSKCNAEIDTPTYVEDMFIFRRKR